MAKTIINLNDYHESRITRLEVTIENINKTLERFDSRFDSIDNKFDLIDKKFDLVDKKFDSVNKKMEEGFSNLHREINDVRKESWSQMRWMLSFIVIFSGSPVLISILKSLNFTH